MDWLRRRAVVMQLLASASTMCCWQRFDWGRAIHLLQFRLLRLHLHQKQIRLLNPLPSGLGIARLSRGWGSTAGASLFDYWLLGHCRGNEHLSEAQMD